MCEHIFYCLGFFVLFCVFFDQQMRTHKNLQVAIYNVTNNFFFFSCSDVYMSDSLKTKDKSFKQGLMDNILILVVFCC